jgi:hypothetical protein
MELDEEESKGKLHRKRLRKCFMMKERILRVIRGNRNFETSS